MYGQGDRENGGKRSDSGTVIRKRISCDSESKQNQEGYDDDNRSDNKNRRKKVKTFFQNISLHT